MLKAEKGKQDDNNFKQNNNIMETTTEQTFPVLSGDINATELYFVLEALHKHVKLMRENQTLYFTSNGRSDVSAQARQQFLINSKVQEKIVDKLILKVGVFYAQVSPTDQKTYSDLINKKHIYKYFKISDNV